MRTTTFNMEDALISPESFAILSGAGLLDASQAEGGAMYVHTTNQVVVTKANTVVLEDIACWNGTATGTPKDGGLADDYYHHAADIFVMVLENGIPVEEPCLPAAVEYTPEGTVITCYSHKGNLAPDSVVLVDYYVKRTAGAKQIEITPDKFGGAFYLEASTLFREESSGVDMPAEFIIPNCRIQSNFTFSMAASGDPSVFSFVMDAFPDLFMVWLI